MTDADLTSDPESRMIADELRSRWPQSASGA